MSTSEQAKPKRNLKPLWIGLAFASLIIITFLPNSGDLPIAGQRALAILAFAVILWVTEAVSYPVSSAMIIALVTILLGLAPSMEDPTRELGTSDALKLALSGFSNSAVALVAAALFLAAAMQITNLHKRLALWILSLVGTKTKAIVFGAILVSIALAFFVPSATARAGAVVPILLGMVAAFGLPRDSRLAALLVITSVQAVSIWNIGIKTAAAQNMVALNFIKEQFGVDISWGAWLLYAAPFSIIMSVALFFIMITLIKPETSNIEGGKEVIKKQLAELGPLKAPEIRLIITSVVLLFFWAAEGKLHPFDTTTVTIVAIAILLMPKIGVYSWKQVEPHIPWGTIIVFAVGIMLGTVLLNTKGASWLSDKVFGSLGLDSMPILATIALVTLFNILIHLGFASATSLASALVPVFIVLASTLTTNVDQVGFVIVQQFVISFGFLLPISAPQNMLAYGTGAFTTKDFLKSGIPLTIIGYILVLLFSATYWKWIGLL
ncbi:MULTISPECIES: DASS family sodium-coupled anion symporter [unclassified Lysinibacillus]|uniref:DASS family sodium-coupled anion symporter n=1 Tax=unclassified Lysinibacillus TaxID=2636778 RepID=UPI002011295D|nr:MULTISPECIES: DASS family sodium-coupled anion symporter [unclassified Lysinibacillus]MCL1698610.1 anion permease [Lysinibacillus sp. BPa_S21]MCL1703395.1 anion permease [Lysinibacillus sp. Bpr_S20]